SAGLLVRWSIGRTYDTAADRVLKDASHNSEAQFHQLANSVVEAASALENDHEVGDLLLALAKSDDERLAELSHRAPEIMSAHSLDVLTIADPRGRILACGHMPARSGESDVELVGREKKYRGQPLLVPEQMREGGGLVSALAVEAAQTV